MMNHCMVRPTLIGLNSVEIKYYLFIVSLNKCIGRCNVSAPKLCVTSKTKNINVKIFNMIKNRNEARTMTKHISCHCECKFNSATDNSNQKWNNKACQCEYHN